MNNEARAAIHKHTKAYFLTLRVTAPHLTLSLILSVIASVTVIDKHIYHVSNNPAPIGWLLNPQKLLSHTECTTLVRPLKLDVGPTRSNTDGCSIKDTLPCGEQVPDHCADEVQRNGHLPYLRPCACLEDVAGGEGANHACQYASCVGHA